MAAGKQSSLPTMESEIKSFSRAYSFSDREAEVFALIVNRSKTSEDIASRLGVSPNTIRNHFQSIFQKTKTNSKTELLALFLHTVFDAKDNPQAKSTKGSPLTVVYADDDEAYGDLVRRAMAKGRFKGEMYLVKDGDELLDFLKHRGDYAYKPPRPDLILVDLKMPRKDGHQLIEEIRGDDEFRAIPIVALTTSDDPEDIRKTYELGGNSYLQKPAGFRALVDLVQTLEKYWVGIGKVYRPYVS